jgi:hypothetical protein
MAPRILTTVITPALSYDLTTLAVVKDELRVTDAASDTFISRQIAWASAAATSYCDRVFQVETIKDEFWAPRDFYPGLLDGRPDILQLTRWPAVTITNVTEDGVALVVTTDYRIDLEHGQLLRVDANAYPRPWPAVAIAVQYTAGYATIPVDVADAVVRMVKTRWFARERDPMLRGESIPGVRDVQYWVPTGDDAGSMSPDVVDLLDGYRVPVIA